MTNENVISWLLKGDISIQYQTYRDLLGINKPRLQNRILKEGWGAKYLSLQRPDGHWGQKFYQPKWTSSHYTLLDLRNLCPSQNNQKIRNIINVIFKEQKSPDGGILPIGSDQKSDVCVVGMFLNYACYFKADENELKSVVDFILSQRMKDGGFNCQLNRSGAKHSSLHSTLSVLEGITEYDFQGYTYRLKELKEAQKTAVEFILLHQLFISDRTGEIIRKDFLRLTFPCRWRYDILKAMDYFQYSKAKWDDRMKPAIEVLLKKKNKTQTWNVQAKHPGQIHFEMEKAGKPSRWNTLRVLRVFKHFEIENIKSYSFK